MTRDIVVKITLKMDFPDGYDDELIRFCLNEGSWCASNIIPILEDYDRTNGCLCNICEFEVIPLADEEKE